MITASEDFVSLERYYHDPDLHLRWNLVFTIPAWLKTWWQSFGSGAELLLRSVRNNDRIIGIAPLQIRNQTASIIGSVDVCDYQDFIVVPGNERDFFAAVLDDLQQKGIRELHLEAVRSDSSITAFLIPLARERKYNVDYRQSDVSSDIDLPRNWDEYLKMLDTKQRRELQRKIRNLQKTGETFYRTISNPEILSETMGKFLKLFPESRSDKARFMTPIMQNFFRSLADSLADTEILRFGALETAGITTAMVMYFDYNENRYLYNSAYDPNYKLLSAGIISKARCIQDSIEQGKKKFDFLKGSEKYKSYLGGQEIPLFSCHIKIG